MKKSILLFVFIHLALMGIASATPTTVGDFRGTVQTDTTAGVHTITLGTDTTIVRLNASTLSEIVGMTGGADGRMVFFWNIGTANSLVYSENTTATAANRFVMDVAAGGFRYLFSSGLGLGVAIYDGTTSRWRFATWEGFNGTGNLIVNGDFSTTGSALVTSTLTTGNTTISAVDTVRLKLKSLTSGNNGSTLRWQNSAGSSLFSMGPDYNGNAGLDFWLYDNTNSVNNLYIKNTGTSYLAFGTSLGGIQYQESNDELALYATGLIRLRLTEVAFKIGTHPYYQRRASGTAKPALGSDCNGTGTATWARDDSGDVRGAVTLGTGSSACTLTFTVPWNLVQGQESGQPICVANTSTSGRSIAVTSIGDHSVTFTPSTSGATTVYYHCDGLQPPP